MYLSGIKLRGSGNFSPSSMIPARNGTMWVPLGMRKSPTVVESVEK